MYTYFANDDQVTLINISNGNRVSMYEGDKNYEKFMELIIAGDYVAAEALDPKLIVKSFSTGNIHIDDGVGTVIVHGQRYPLNDALTDRILKMAAAGFSAVPFQNFINNVYLNPSKTAVDELFLFLDNNELPITEDGCFIAYKMVRKDYKDIYSGTMDNSVGQVVSMPRFAVDDDRSNTCAAGLHFCSKDYLQYYSSRDGDTDRCVLVKINPADVVSIPSDYNNAKGRTCRYEVVGEVHDENWRKNLSSNDYTDAPVVNVSGVEDSGPDEEKILDDNWATVIANGFYHDCDHDTWMTMDGKPVSSYYVSAITNIPTDVLEEMVQ